MVFIYDRRFDFKGQAFYNEYLIFIYLWNFLREIFDRQAHFYRFGFFACLFGLFFVIAILSQAANVLK